MRVVALSIGLLVSLLACLSKVFRRTIPKCWHLAQRIATGVCRLPICYREGKVYVAWVYSPLTVRPCLVYYKQASFTNSLRHLVLLLHGQ